MNDDLIVTAYVVIAELLANAGHRDHALAQVGDAEILTVAVVAAAAFQNHQARTLQVMQGHTSPRVPCTPRQDFRDVEQ